MIKKLANTFLSDTLLIGSMLLWLFVFVCMLVVPEHVVAMYEDNLVILSLEIMLCVFAITWSVVRVTRNLRRKAQ